MAPEDGQTIILTPFEEVGTLRARRMRLARPPKGVHHCSLSHRKPSGKRDRFG